MTEILLAILLVLVLLVIVDKVKDRKKEDKKRDRKSPKKIWTPKVKTTTKVVDKITPKKSQYPSIKTIGNRFLWKPVADSRGGVLVVLTPKGWKQREVELWNEDENVKLSGKIEYRGLTNGDRETYFFLGVFARNLPKRIVFKLGDEKYFVEDPNVRVG